MNTVTLGQAVIVTDRRHPLSYEEGTVFRAAPDGHGRIRVHFPQIEGEPQPNNSWHAIELEILGAMPSPGERYEWADRNNASRVPFTVGERFPRNHRYAGLFALLADDASPAERAAGYSSIASAAEIAKFADRTPIPAVKFPPGSPEYVAYQIALTEELEKFVRGESPYALERVREHLGQKAPTEVSPVPPGDAAAQPSPLSLADRMRKWADDGLPRPWQASKGGPGAPVRAFAAELDAHQARADALADAVAALYQANYTPDGKWDAVGAALKAYRQAAQ